MVQSANFSCNFICSLTFSPPPTSISGFVVGFILKWKDRPACYNGHDHIPDNRDCHTFYHCWGYRLMPKSCGPFLMFNPVTKVCDWPPLVVAIRPQCNLFTDFMHTFKSVTSTAKKPKRPLEPVTTSTTTTTTTTTVPKSVQNSTNTKKSSTLSKNKVIFIKPMLDLFSRLGSLGKKSKVKQRKNKKKNKNDLTLDKKEQHRSINSKGKENELDDNISPDSCDSKTRKHKSILGLNGLFDLSSLKVFTKNTFDQLSNHIP